MRTDRVKAAVYGSPWAIHPTKFEAICDFIDAAAMGAALPEFQAAEQPAGVREGSVQVLPVRGTIAQRMNMMSDFSGGTSTEKLGKQIRDAAADSSIAAIVLDVDSPGGSVHGIEELGREIVAAKAAKPVVAVANSFAASAAYWIASQASELVIAPGAEVGSIGVLAMHVDQSAFNESMGIKPTFVHAGQYKVEGNPHEPLGDDARAYLQAQVDEHYRRFVDAVAAGREVSRETVLSDFGQGRMLMDHQAVRVGMADRVDTLRNTITRLSSARVRSRLMRARMQVAALA